MAAVARHRVNTPQLDVGEPDAYWRAAALLEQLVLLRHRRWQDRPARCPALVGSSSGVRRRTHTLMVPGGGMGAYFKGIHNGGTTWLSQMKAQTGRFAFLYKHMPSHPEPICKLGRHQRRWDYYVGYTSRTSVERQIQYLREDMGLADLERYMHGNRSRFPNHTHVVFWGDVNEGIYALSALDNEPKWNYNTARALHTLLVKRNHWHGYFLDLPFTYAGRAKPEVYGYMITVDKQTGTRAKNHTMNRSKTHTAWWEWHNWAYENAAF